MSAQTSAHMEAGEIQAWLDDELKDDASLRVQTHLEGCAHCREEAEALQRTGAGVTSALSLLDAPPSTTVDEARWEVRRRWARGRGRGSRKRSVAAAAILVLVAGGAAAVMPGSPLKSLWSDPGTDVVASTQAMVDGETDRMGVAASYREGRLEIGLEDAPTGFEIELRMGSGERVEVRAHPDARFSAASGRIDVTLVGESGGHGLDVRVPPGSGEVLLRSGPRFLVRWSGGRFELGEGIDADPLPDGVRLRVPERLP